MQLFRGRVEITAKNVVPGLRAAIRTGFRIPLSGWPTRQ